MRFSPVGRARVPKPGIRLTSAWGRSGAGLVGGYAGGRDEGACRVFGQRAAASSSIPSVLKAPASRPRGVSDQVGHARMEALCRAHAADPQALADALGRCR